MEKIGQLSLEKSEDLESSICEICDNTGIVSDNFNCECKYCECRYGQVAENWDKEADEYNKWENISQIEKEEALIQYENKHTLTCEICKGKGTINYHDHIIECASCKGKGIIDSLEHNKETEQTYTSDKTAPKHDSEENKPDLSLVPYDLINEMLIPAYEEGLQEYYRDSWRLGFKVSRMVAALLRHLFAFVFKHEDYDPVAYKKYRIKKHHLGAVIFCAISIYNSLKIDPERFDDRILKNEKK